MIAVLNQISPSIFSSEVAGGITPSPPVIDVVVHFVFHAPMLGTLTFRSLPMLGFKSAWTITPASTHAILVADGPIACKPCSKTLPRSSLIFDLNQSF
jgi:hypothetical protein